MKYYLLRRRLCKYWNIMYLRKIGLIFNWRMFFFFTLLWQVASHSFPGLHLYKPRWVKPHLPATHTLFKPISMEIVYKCTEFDRFAHSCISEGRIHPIWFSVSAPIPKLHQDMSKPNTEQRTILVDSSSSFHVSIQNQCWSPAVLVCGSAKSSRDARVAQGGGEWHTAPLEQPAAEAATPLLLSLAGAESCCFIHRQVNTGNTVHRVFPFCTAAPLSCRLISIANILIWFQKEI